MDTSIELNEYISVTNLNASDSIIFWIWTLIMIRDAYKAE